MDDYSVKINRAIKWSTATEVIKKIIAPITNMILARLLLPEVFGIIALVNLVISFGEIIAEAGFNKYIVQSELDDENNFSDYYSVAFWSNITFAIILYIFIVLFNTQIAVLVGNPGLGSILIVAGLQIPLYAITGSQFAAYRRHLDFHRIFPIRIISALIPLIITIPLALMGYEHWSIIVGTICSLVVLAMYLMIKSPYRPKLYYSFKKLKTMLSFSLFSLFESLTYWLTIWLDIFLIGQYFSEYELGIYKNSVQTITSFYAIFSASILPVLFAGLSRLQTNPDKFKETFYKLQKNTALVVIPAGIGIFLYRDFVTNVLFGSEWSDASNVIGLVSLVLGCTVIYSYFVNEAIRAIGKPWIAMVSQLISILAIYITVQLTYNLGFDTFVYYITLVRFVMILSAFIISEFVLKISVIKTLMHTLSYWMSAVVMGGIVYAFNWHKLSMSLQFATVIVCMIIYFGILLLIPNERRTLVDFAIKIKKTMTKTINKIKKD